MIPFPNKKYNIIYADPPWSYNSNMMNSSVTDHYSVMNINDICNLPVKNIADDNCILFMWVTLPKLNEFMNVINSWGFEYKTTAFVWCKKNKISDSKSVRQLQVFPIGSHSKKPDEFKKLILELVGDLPRIELFARQKTEGWDVWGNEV
jgi:N6-adenosine-specific RNA methylase IME4